MLFDYYTRRELLRGLKYLFTGGLDGARRIRNVDINPETARFLRLNPRYVNKYPVLTTIEEAYFRGRIADDWNNLKDHIPSNTKSILDIGCGVAGVQIAIYHHLNRPKIHLIDKAKRKQFNETINVIDAARKLLICNQVAESDVFIYDSEKADSKSQLSNQKFDFILSTRGLAFMFPFSTYADVISKSLQPGGTFITDILKIENENDLIGDPLIRDRFINDGLVPSIVTESKIAEILGTKPICIYETSKKKRIKVIKKY